MTVSVPQRGEKKDLVDHALANAREALGRELAQSAIAEDPARRARRALRPGRAAAADRGLRQQPHHGHQRRRRDDRRRAGGLREGPVPEVQHPLRGPYAGRRLRHDARGARPPLLAAPSRSGTARGEQRGRRDARAVAGPRPHRRRARPARQRQAKSSPSLASATCRSLASPRARIAMPAARPSSWRAASRSCCSRAIPSSISSQRLRDEAHRFAIGSHRTRRRIEMGRNPLDEIDGIGPTRKRALLRHFGTAKAVSRASIDRPPRGGRDLGADGAGDLRPFPRAERVARHSPGT